MGTYQSNEKRSKLSLISISLLWLFLTLFYNKNKYIDFKIEHIFICLFGLFAFWLVYILNGYIVSKVIFESNCLTTIDLSKRKKTYDLESLRVNKVSRIKNSNLVKISFNDGSKFYITTNMENIDQLIEAIGCHDKGT